MPVDPSIPLRVKPARFVGPQEVISLQNLARQGELQQTQLNELARERADKDTLKQLIGKGMGPKGQMDPVMLGNISAIDPKIGQLFAAQNETIRLRDLKRSEAKDKVTLNLGTAYVQSYDNALQQTGGNKDAAEKFARETTLKAIDDAQRSGTFAAQGLTDVDVMGLRQIRDPETMRGVVTILGGKIERPTAKPSERRTYQKGGFEVTEEFDPNTRQWKEIGRGPKFKPDMEGGKAPAGYRFTKTGDLEAIPGGPADVKAGEAAVKAEKTAEMAKVKAGVVTSTVDSALKQLEKFQWFGSDIPGSGLRRKAGSYIAGTDAYDLEQTINTVKANLGFKELADMRAASPTGGALGQIAVRELEFLQAAVAALDVGQSQTQLRDNLKKIKTHFENWKDAAEKSAKPSPQRRASDRQGALTPEEQAELDTLRKKFGK